MDKLRFTSSEPFAVAEHDALGGLSQARQESQDRRFARAGLTQQGEHFPFFHLEIDVVEDGHGRTAARRKGFGNVVEFHDGVPGGVGDGAGGRR